MNLVIRRAAPPHLWVPLLFAAIPVMEASPPAFSTADTEQLLLAIQVCDPCTPSIACICSRRIVDKHPTPNLHRASDVDGIVETAMLS